MRQVTTKEIGEFLMKYLREKRKISERSINYYNSVIRFIYDVVLDKPINQKQIPMYKKKRRLPKILSDEELDVFFNACDNYMYKIIFMLIYGSGLRISEATNIRVEDIDSKNIKLNNYEKEYMYNNLDSFYLVTYATDKQYNIEVQII